MRPKLIAVAMFALFFHAAFAIDIANFEAWLPLYGLAFSIGFALAVLAYMLSTLFKSPELGVWAKLEMGEVVLSIVFASLVLFALQTSDTLFQAAVGGSPMSVSAGFLNDATLNLLNVYKNSINAQFVLSMLSGVPPQYKSSNSDVGSGGTTNSPFMPYLDDLKYTRDSTVVGFPTPLYIMYLTLSKAYYQPYSGLQPFNIFFSSIQTTTLMAIAINIVIGMMLNLVNGIALPILLPLGVLLRAFSVTRKFGSTLIAVAFCLYFFFPLSVVMSKVLYDSVPKIPAPSASIMGLPLQILDTFNPNYRVSHQTGLPGVDTILDILGTALDWLGGRLSPQISVGGVQVPVRLLSPDPTPPFTPFMQTGINPSSVMLGANGNIFSQNGITAGNFYGFTCYPILLASKVTALSPWTAWLTPILISAWGYCIPVQFVHISADAIFQFKDIVPFIAQFLGTEIVKYFEPITAFFMTLRQNDIVTQDVVNLIADFIPHAVSYSAPIVIMPIIILIVVVTSIRSISPAIGGEAQILGVSELM